MKIKILAESATEPITLEEAMVFCKVDNIDDAEADLIRMMIKAARIFCEEYTGEAYIEKTIQAEYGCYDLRPFELMYPPFIEILAIETLNDGVLSPLLRERYRIIGSHSVSVEMKDEWQLSVGKLNPDMIITYRCGGSCPDDVKIAMGKMLFTLYENRGEFSPDMVKFLLPVTAKSLISHRRKHLW